MNDYGLRLTITGLVVAALAVTGCSHTDRSTAHIQGMVTVGGKPLPADSVGSLSIRTLRAGQGRGAGASIVDGKFDCKDAPLGKVKVYINVQHPTGKMITESDGVPFKEFGSLISPKYSTGIDLDISGDNPNQNFDLEPI